MVGPPPSASLLARANELGVDGQIEFRVDASDDEIQTLYQTAAVLLFPSVYEGFGWPPLEAMAAGCPVVCSDAGSLAEVVSDAAITRDVNDWDGLAEACRLIMTDHRLAETMRTRGRKRASEFTLESFRDGIRGSWLHLVDSEH